MSPRKRLTHKKRCPPGPEQFPEHQGSRRVDPLLYRKQAELDSHPVTCGCRFCLLELGAELDPDSMEDDNDPYFWNRRNW